MFPNSLPKMDETGSLNLTIDLEFDWEYVIVV
jgi:hypothetical protein